MIKVLLIGKNSFIASNLKQYLKKTFNLTTVNFSKFKKLEKKKLIKFNFVINCSIKKEYAYKKYLSSNDNDLIVGKKIKDLPIKMIMLSSRKVYQASNNIKESQILNPKCNYSKNKVITERKLDKILSKKF